MTVKPIPADFILSKLTLTWRDIKWGYHHDWLNTAGVVDCAIARIEGHDESSDAITLASLSPKEGAEARMLLDGLSRDEGEYDEEISIKRWLCLILAWIYDQREQLPDPLGAVEDIYADFNYPVEIRSFVRYMPPEDGYEPRAHSYEENIARLFRNWASYLQDCRR